MRGPLEVDRVFFEIFFRDFFPRFFAPMTKMTKKKVEKLRIEMKQK